MRHSTKTEIFWWDRVRTRYLGDVKIEALTRRLGESKAIVNVALKIAILYVLSSQAFADYLQEESYWRRFGIVSTPARPLRPQEN
jgi:hypothetical protein